MTDDGERIDRVSGGTEPAAPDALGELAAQRDLYAAFVEGAPDAMVVTSPDGIIQYANPAAEALVDCERGALVGRSMMDLVDQQDLARRPVNRARVDAGETAYNQRRLLRRDHEGVWVETATRKLPDGRLQFWLRDLSARQKLEVELRAAQKLEATGLLAAGLAHDLNNLLTVIAGNARLLARRGGDSTETDTIALATERASVLTRKLLTFARVEGVRVARVDLNRVVRESLPLVRSIAGDGIDIVLDLAGELDPVEADAGQLDQALWNLVTNACQAMAGAGRLTLSTRNARLDEGELRSLSRPRLDPRFVCLSVTDTGRGMDAPTAARAFDPFFTTKEAGNGLGLSVVQGILAQHGGLTRIDSEVGRGTRFDLLLPSAAPG